MANVWKIGTRWSDWGNSAASVLSIMRRNNVAFVWLDEGARDRFIKDVRKGDYIALADGYQIVAIGKATGAPAYLRDLKNFQVSEQDYADFSLEDGWDNIVAVKINIVDIDEEDKSDFYFQKQARFCALYQLWNETIEYYESHLNRFEITSYTATILKPSGESKALLNPKARYTIPIYQRPYEWTEGQITPFIKDIIGNYLGKDGTGRHSEPMFIGTMQLSKRKPISNVEYQHDVVDGQQRITTLTIFLKELQRNYPDCKRLASLKFNWLQTHVSEQQGKYLFNYLNDKEAEDQNPYQRNSAIIWNTFDMFLQNQEEESKAFDIERFCDYIFHSVCFVVIETSAGLSKTIQIFNTINNTGLDLNGSDVFKVRMYEYLRDVKNEDETVFEQIQSVYTLIDEKNKEQNICLDMGTMLDLYKNILITEYDLNTALYAYGWDTFFDRLFDSLLGINEWDHFKNLNGLELSLSVLKEVIEMRYEKEAYKYSRLEAKFATRMISDFSRYRWSQGLVMYPFLFFYRHDANKYEQLERLLVVLNKYFFIHSIEHSKQIYEVNTYISKLVKSIKTSSSDDIINSILERISLEDQESLYWHIGKDIINGSKWWRYLVCGVSTYLVEKNSYKDDEEVLAKVFNKWEFDIEHIHATADPTQEIPEELQNSIGNLTPLEYDINRSIKDSSFDQKKIQYAKSWFKTIREIAKKDSWDLDCIVNRRDVETKKIFDYIVGN